MLIFRAWATCDITPFESENDTPRKKKQHLMMRPSYHKIPTIRAVSKLADFLDIARKPESKLPKDRVRSLERGLSHSTGESSTNLSRC